jgi:hypothetical protein
LSGKARGVVFLTAMDKEIVSQQEKPVPMVS